jgi:hypothetical protein
MNPHVAGHLDYRLHAYIHQQFYCNYIPGMGERLSESYRAVELSVRIPGNPFLFPGVHNDCDRLIHYQRSRAVLAPFERGSVHERFKGTTGLAHRLKGPVEAGTIEPKAPYECPNVACVVLDAYHSALDLWDGLMFDVKASSVHFRDFEFEQVVGSVTDITFELHLEPEVPAKSQSTVLDTIIGLFSFALLGGVIRNDHRLCQVAYHIRIGRRAV